MPRRLLSLIALTLMPAFLAASSQNGPSAVANPAPLRDLVDEPSRGQLFERIKDAEAAADPLAAAQDITKFSLYGPFRFPNDTTFDVIENHPRPPAVYGVDVSHYTPTAFPIESLYQRNISFVYVKATQGTTFRDGKFAGFWSRLAKLPPGQQIHRGAYHFLTAAGDGKSQADVFLSIAADNDSFLPTDMPPVVDLEWDVVTAKGPDRWVSRSPDEIIASVKAWCEEVKRRTGRTPMIYTAAAWWKERIGSEQRFKELAQYPLWIADYSKSARGIEVPTVPGHNPWNIWQFTAAATLASGFEGGFDANIFKGSANEFYGNLHVKQFAQ